MCVCIVGGGSDEGGMGASVRLSGYAFSGVWWAQYDSSLTQAAVGIVKITWYGPRHLAFNDVEESAVQTQIPSYMAGD
jgi:hypothetical protein